jgi:hypothetical protein
MAKRAPEGNPDQKRKAAREAKAQGKRPSEMGATTGASQQYKSAPRNASHQERLELKNEGKANPKPGNKARPGNRDEDPKRTNRYG